MSDYIPNYGAALLVEASWKRRAQARLDLAITRKIVRQLGVPWREPPKLYSHVLFVKTARPVTGWRHLDVEAWEWEETFGCRCRQVWPEERFDIYDWPDRGEHPVHKGQEARMEQWWNDHWGERYGYFRYMRMAWNGALGLVLPIDFTRVRLTGPGFVCSTGWAALWELVGRKLHEKLDVNNVTPHMVAARLELKAERWRP